MTPGSSDPTVIRSLSVTAEDVVTAVETNATSDRTAVLRVTPPFSARMRARLHVEVPGEYTGETPRPVHIDPKTLLDSDAPTYPRPADTEDEIRAATDLEYSVERHHEHHTARVSEWRKELPGAVRDGASIQTREGSHEVSISVLGEPPGNDGAES
jgi:hypothetical protein